MKPRYLSLVFTAFLSISLSGCDNAAIDRRIKEFDSALIKSSAAIRTYYEQLNDLERTTYFDELRFEPKMPMAETKTPASVATDVPIADPAVQQATPTQDDSDTTPTEVRVKLAKAEYATGLLTKFNPADIQVRIAAVQTLGKFGEGLAALSGSDAPVRAGKSVEEIGDEIQAISAHVASLSGKKSPDFAAYAGPISTIGGIVTTRWFKAKQQDSVRKSIVESKDSVQTLIKQLKRELKRLDKSILQLSAEQSLQYRIDYYNRVYSKADVSADDADKMIEDAKRKVFLSETQIYALRVAKVKAVAPNDLVNNLESAYIKLLKAVETKPSLFDLFKEKDRQARAEDFKDLTQAIGAFLEEANRVAEAVKELKQISQQH